MGVPRVLTHLSRLAPKREHSRQVKCKGHALLIFLRKNHLSVRFLRDCSQDDLWHMEKANSGVEQQCFSLRYSHINLIFLHCVTLVDSCPSCKDPLERIFGVHPFLHLDKSQHNTSPDLHVAGFLLVIQAFPPNDSSLDILLLDLLSCPAASLTWGWRSAHRTAPDHEE